jgi:hypothetical protein
MSTSPSIISSGPGAETLAACGITAGFAEGGQLLQCMEVWGGSTPANRGVSIPGLDAWVYSRPFEDAEEGGDVYYVSSCATGRITRLLVADVAGHGAGVRELAGVLRELMRRYVNQLDQCQFVRSMNRKFTEMSDVGSFATALVTTFFAPTNTLTVCNAGHPAPLLYRAREREWSILERLRFHSRALSNIPLGIEDVADYEQFTLQLEPEDLVLAYSDSLIESQGAGGELLGEQGLLEVVRALDVSDPTTLVQRLLLAISALSPGNLDHDDVTAMLFRANGSGQAPLPLRTKVTAALRVMRASVESMLGLSGPMPLPDLNFANVGGALVDRLNQYWSGGRRREPAQKAETGIGGDRGE